MESEALVLGEKRVQQLEMMKHERKEIPQLEMIMPTSLRMEESQRHENITEFN